MSSYFRSRAVPTGVRLERHIQGSALAAILTALGRMYRSKAELEHYNWPGEYNI